MANGVEKIMNGIAADTKVKLLGDLHVALHEFVGQGLQRISHRLGPTVSGPDQVKLDLSQPTDEPKLRERIFRFSESSIDRIKSTVNSATPSDGSKPFSTFQSLSAHIWSHVTHARCLKPEDVTVCTVFADCRNRVDLPMPEPYFGNLIQAIFTGIAAGLILVHTQSFGATIIRKAIASHDAAAINERNKRDCPKDIPVQGRGGQLRYSGELAKVQGVGGELWAGKVREVRSGSNNRFNGMMYLYQGKSGGRNIDVEISLEVGAMERLDMDKALLLD